MNNGWIKLHNKFLKWEWFDKPEMVSLWIYLLLAANWQDGNWHGQIIKRGQLVTGLYKLQEDTGISIQTLRTCLRKLQKNNQIIIKSTNKYRIITIVKYNDYQQDDRKLTNNQQTTNKQLTTIEDYKTNKTIYIADKPAIDRNSLIEKLSLPKPIRSNITKWQDEAVNAKDVLNCPENKISSLFKCFKENQPVARIALSDCKELGKHDAMYFFKVFNEIKKKQI